MRERGDVPLVLLRVAGVYDDHCHSIPIVHQIKSICENSLIARVFPGDISRGHSFVHRKDPVDVLAKPNLRLKLQIDQSVEEQKQGSRLIQDSVKIEIKRP